MSKGKAKAKVEVDNSLSEEEYDDELINSIKKSLDEQPKPLDELSVKDKLYITAFSPTKYGFLLTDKNKKKYYSNFDVNRFLNKFITESDSSKLYSVDNYGNYKLKKKLVLICKETKTFKKDDKEYQNNYFEFHFLKQ